MKKLKNKILITIFLIFSISMIIILITYNSSEYIREKNNISENLSRMNKENHENIKPPKEYDALEPPESDTNQKKRFMDVSIYTFVLDENNTISTVISHTDEDEIPKDAVNEANKLLNSSKLTDKHIGNLYFNKYAYKYSENKKLILIDISETNKKLRVDLLISIIIFIIFETIAYLISKVISLWIIKPVEASFNNQKQFIADASHELKTPLSVIIASAEALENDKNNKKWLNNIKNESDRMNNLIKDLLDLAKLENDEIKRVYENNNLSKLVEMSILPFESLIYEKNIKLDYNLEDNIYLKSDSNEIKQLVAILMDNAIKHSKSDGKINVKLKKEKDFITLSVKNKGEPIPKGEEEKIFERFYRVDKARNRKDNRYGLGLAIAKSIVERHNGTIKASSTEEYTTFEIIFKK